MTTLAGKRVVVTGSSRGLGRAFAVEMARAGASLVVNGTNAEALAETVRLVEATGANVVAVQGSVSEAATCKALVDRCVETFGGIDILVNNAGQVRDRTLFKMSDEDFDEVIAVHLRGTFLCSRNAAQAMRDHGGGHIVHVVSNSGLSGGFGQSNYAAAKAGMMGLLHTWVLELARYNIRCNAFWPIAETDMTQVVFTRARDDAAKKGEAAPDPAAMGFGTPQQVAQGMVWLASDRSRRFNGQCFTFNGRKTALWTHPREIEETFHREPWTVDELDAHYAAVEPLAPYSPKFVE